MIEPAESSAQIGLAGAADVLRLHLDVRTPAASIASPARTARPPYAGDTDADLQLHAAGDGDHWHLSIR